MIRLLDLEDAAYVACLDQQLKLHPDLYVSEHIHLHVFAKNTKLFQFWGVFENEKLKGFIYHSPSRANLTTYYYENETAKAEISSFLEGLLKQKGMLMLTEVTLDGDAEQNLQLHASNLKLDRSSSFIRHDLNQKNDFALTFRSTEAAPENIPALAELLKHAPVGEEVFPHEEAFLRLVILLGKVYIIQEGDSVVSMAGTSIMSDEAAIVDFLCTSKLHRGQGFNFDCFSHLISELVREKRQLYAYAVRPGVLRMFYDVGFKKIGTIRFRVLTAA